MTQDIAPLCNGCGKRMTSYTTGWWCGSCRRRDHNAVYYTLGGVPVVTTAVDHTKVVKQ